MLNKITRRQTISDNLITPEIQDKIAMKVYEKVENVYDLSQIEIVKIMLDMKLSNETIAKIVNKMIPKAHATKGSVASLIKHIRNGNNLLNELLEELEWI